VTTVSLARFKNKKITLKNGIVFSKKSFDTGWGVGAHQLQKTFLPKNYTI
jgi:hypothetical protein